MVDVLIENINFSEDEQDFETDGGHPVVISSIGSPQVFNSYLMVGDQEIKLYNPSPSNVSISWDVKLLLDRAKFLLVQDLIMKQTVLVKNYRKSKNTNSMEGFIFRYGSINTKVWLTSFTNSGAFFSTIRSKELIRCKLTVQETE